MRGETSNEIAKALVYPIKPWIFIGKISRKLDLQTERGETNLRTIVNTYPIIIIVSSQYQKLRLYPIFLHSYREISGGLGQPDKDHDQQYL
jgi:hypothetical protein